MKFASTFLQTEDIGVLNLAVSDIAASHDGAELVAELQIPSNSKLVVQLGGNSLITSLDLDNVSRLVKFLQLLNVRTVIAGINTNAAATLATFADTPPFETVLNTKQAIHALSDQ